MKDKDMKDKDGKKRERSDFWVTILPRVAHDPAKNRESDQKMRNTNMAMRITKRDYEG